MNGTDSPWKLLGMWVPWGSHPLVRTVEAGWAASPVERLAALLRARDVPVGLVSDGRWWALVWAPRGKPVGAASGTPRSGARSPRPSPPLSPCWAASASSASPPHDRLPALLRAQRRGPGRSHSRPRRPGPRRGGDARRAPRRPRPPGGWSPPGRCQRRRPLRRGGHGHDAGVVPALRGRTPAAAQRRRPLRLELLGRPAGRTARAARGNQWRTDPRAPKRRLAPSARGRPGAAPWGRSRGPSAAALRRRPVRPRPLPVARRRREQRPPPRGRPHRPAHARGRAVRPPARRAPPAHLPRSRCRTDRLRLRRAPRARGPHRHRARHQATPARQEGHRLRRPDRCPAGRRDLDAVGRHHLRRGEESHSGAAQVGGAAG